MRLISKVTSMNGLIMFYMGLEGYCRTQSFPPTCVEGNMRIVKETEISTTIDRASLSSLP